MSIAADESMPVYLGLSVVAIILIAIFSKGGADEKEAPKAKVVPPPVATNTNDTASSSTAKKSKKKKKKAGAPTAKAAAPALVEEKKEETVVVEEEAEPEVTETVKTSKKKKKKKAKKKSTSANGSAAAAPVETAPVAEPKKVVFAADDDDEEDDSDDDVDLWVIQSSSKRKGANDAAKRAAANKERERLKKQQAAAAKEKKAKEAAAAEEALAAEIAAAEAAAAEKEASAAKAAAAKKNGASVLSEVAPASSAPATVTGEKKKRKRNKKKKKAADEGSTPATPAPVVPLQWETVPVVEEWQEVGTKKSKGKTAAATDDDAAAAFASDEPVVEEAGEVSMTMDAGSDPLILIGKGGATITMLQQTTGAKFNLNRTTNVLTITGSEESVELGLAQARSILATEAERKANEVTENVTWTSDAVKGVIGKGGANIRATEEATGCKIDADVEAGTLSITGPSSQVAIALTMCHNAAFGEVQDVLELGSRNAVNVVYGPNFQTIRGLQDSTGCRLDIDRGTTTLKLAGSAEAVAKATTQIRALLEANRGFEMTIENSKVGSVYGKGGETLRSIQDRTGTQIDVSRGPTHATVSVMGSMEASQRARNMLQRAIDGEVELKPGEVAEEVELGSATAAVIGRGGSNVAELEKTHGVKINVRSELQKARIVGRAENVAAASKAIQAIAKPILDAEAAQKKADEQQASGESAWQVDEGDDDADGW
jgi:transcription antitermination factor NusA-like protein